MSTRTTDSFGCNGQPTSALAPRHFSMRRNDLRSPRSASSSPAAPVLMDCGRASQATRGSLFGPFYEGSAPPYTQRQR